MPSYEQMNVHIPKLDARIQMTLSGHHGTGRARDEQLLRKPLALSA
jgi:hypothetical protein